MDSDSARASTDDSKCIHDSNEPNLTGTCVGEEVVTCENSSVKEIDAAASELVPPVGKGEGDSSVGEGDTHVNSSAEETHITTASELAHPVGKGEGEAFNAEISDVAELSPAVGGGGEEKAAFIVQERDSIDSVVPLEPSLVVEEVGEAEHSALMAGEGDSTAEASDSPVNGGHIDDKVQAHLSELNGENKLISEDRLEENKTVSMEEEPPSHKQVDSPKAGEKREDVVDEEDVQTMESEVGQNIESENIKVAQAASLEDIVSSDIDFPDVKEVASVAGFTEIPSQDNVLDDSVFSGSEFVKEEPLQELQIGEGDKTLPDGDAKADVNVTENAMDIQDMKKIDEEGNQDAVAILETQEVDDEAPVLSSTEVSEKNNASVLSSAGVSNKIEAPVLSSTSKETVMDDGKEDVRMDPEADVMTDVVEEDQKKDYVMTDVAEDVEAHGDSSVADIEEEPGLTETQEESVMAETGDEEPEEVEEESKGAGGKRKRGRNIKTMKGTGKKKEEDVCFMCFDGGDLVLCDRRGCPKAYHPTCVDRDEAFFRSKGKWNCGWHLCSKCEKSATYMCYTCMFSVCKGCAKDAVFFCVRGNKGLCETCMETVKLIEKKEQVKEQEKEPAQLDFDDKTSWEYLFKDYWIDLKTQLSLSPEEIDQAKSPQKGHESHASKHGTANETDYATDGGSDSDSSPKKRKTRSRSKSGSAEKTMSPAYKSSSGETVEWASKELLDVVVHMRRGDRSFLPHAEVHKLLLEYIKRYNLRDPRRKSQVICDSRLQNLFGKSNVGHFEMLNLLEGHFLEKEQHQADNIQGSIVDTEPDNVDVDENLDHPIKSGKDKKRKTRKKGVRKGRQSNLDDFAAVDIHNINLIYLRRSLVEDLLEDSTAFEEKVASAFVRLRISGNQKQDLYRLVQVVGTSKAPTPYKVGKKTTDFVLEILNLDKTEVISIDIISNQDFTEDECKRLKQSIKCGLINRLTVGDIQEKAIALQEVRVKNLLDAEILRFSHLRDRASDMGRRKELRECVEKLQLLKSPEERQRRLEEIPEIHADPKMDPDCESEDEDEKEEKEKEKHLRPRRSSFNRRGRDPISPRKGGFSSNDSWTGASNYSNTGANRELTRSYSGRGSTGREDYGGSSDDKFGESMWTSGRERELQQSLGSEKPRSVSLPETAARSSRSVVPPLEVSPRIASEISTTPPAVVLQPVPKLNESEKIWHYKDPSGKVQGPFSMAQLRKWNNTGYFPAKLEIWKAKESPLDSVLLTDALAGLFQKQTQLVDNNFTKTPVAAYSGQASQAEPSLGSTARVSPSILDIPRNSQDTWSSGGSLPSPTPNQITTPTAKRRNFESRWSPTKPSSQSTVQSVNLSLAQSAPIQASRTDIPVIVNSAGAMHPATHPIPTPDFTNASGKHYSSTTTLPSPTPAGGKPSWGSLQTDKFDSYGRGGGDAPSSSQISSAPYGTTHTPLQSQPGFSASDQWRVPVPSQPNPQAQVQAHVPWGVNNSQNSGQPQAPASQNNSWGQGTVNPNMGWVGPGQAGTNVNWTAASNPPTGQGTPNPGWGGPVQGQAQTQAYPNAGWGVAGQAQSQGQVQAPGSNTSSGWMQPGQGIQSGNSSQNWGAQNQTAIPSGGSGGNQGGFWGNQQNQNQNGDSGYGWNRQSSGSGGQNNNFKGQRVCKFFREDGYCRKGASCSYLHK